MRSVGGILLVTGLLASGAFLGTLFVSDATPPRRLAGELFGTASSTTPLRRLTNWVGQMALVRKARDLFRHLCDEDEHKSTDGEAGILRPCADPPWEDRASKESRNPHKQLPET